MIEYIEIQLMDDGVRLSHWHKNGSRSVSEFPLGTQFAFNGKEYIPFDKDKQVQKPVYQWADD